MKSILFTLILITMCLFSYSQKRIYNANGKAGKYAEQDIDIVFDNPTNKAAFKNQDGTEKKVGTEMGALDGLVSGVVNVAYRLATTYFENRVKSFSAEYSKQQSNIHATDQSIPDITFTRKIRRKGEKTSTNALTITFAAQVFPTLDCFIYYVKHVRLDYSGARTKWGYNTMDYALELKLFKREGKELKPVEIAPLSIPSIVFGQDFNDDTTKGMRYRTEFIPMQNGNVLTGAALKVVETNPRKISAQKILDTWNANKDDLKTFLNYLMPKSAAAGGNITTGKD